MRPIILEISRDNALVTGQLAHASLMCPNFKLRPELRDALLTICFELDDFFGPHFLNQQHRLSLN